MPTTLKPPPKKTGLAKHSVKLVVLGWLGFFFVGGALLFSHASDPEHYEPRGHVEISDLDHGGLGADRRAVLEEATRAYVETHPEADAALREGEAFAPEDFLNDELARQGAHWRVRAVEGQHAKVYEIS